jgi:hypothetical protein
VWPSSGSVGAPVPSGRGPLRWSGTPPKQLCQELVGRVLIPGEQPGLSQLAVANMGPQHVPGIKGLALALAMSRATVFLTVLSAVIIALALLADATGFGPRPPCWRWCCR